jgi:hypothetical protein
LDTGIDWCLAYMYILVMILERMYKKPANLRLMSFVPDFQTKTNAAMLTTIIATRTRFAPIHSVVTIVTVNRDILGME